MAQQKKGLITRMLEGKEKSEEYARSTLPTNRWQLFWDIFKGNFGKIVKVNLLMLVFFIPVIVVFVLYSLLNEMNGMVYPFGANLGVGYPAAPGIPGVAGAQGLIGMSESLALETNIILCIGLFISSFIAAVGLSGGMYVIRNMIWTEGIFVTNDFWRGVKLNYKNALQTALFFCICYTLCSSAINMQAWILTVGNVSKTQEVLMNISQVVSYILLILATAMTLWMLALGVNYKLSIFTMLKNSLILTFGSLPQTLFFGVIALVPYVLLFIPAEFFLIMGVFVVLLFALAYTLLVFFDYAQWIFDKYINPKIKGAKVGRGIYSKDGESTMSDEDRSAAELEYRRNLLALGRSRLVARPIKPIDDSLQVYELPQAFTRDDLKKLRESKQTIIEDNEAYAEEHKNDLRYVEYNRQFDEMEEAEKNREEQGKKRKKLKPPKSMDE